jgi:hypothetical protein
MENFSININLNLSTDELNQFYWNLYGTSLVKCSSATKAHVGYTQLIQQLENFFIQQNPDNLIEIEKIKKGINESIDKRKNFN